MVLALWFHEFSFHSDTVCTIRQHNVGSILYEDPNLLSRTATADIIIDQLKGNILFDTCKKIHVVSACKSMHSKTEMTCAEYWGTQG